MVENILPLDTLPDPFGWGQKVKIQLFQNMVMLHIKLKGVTNAATCKYIFCPNTHPSSLGWGQRSKKILKVVMLHIKLIGMEHRAPCKHISCPKGGSKDQNKKNLKVRCHDAYQIKVNGVKSTMQAHILSLHTPSTCGVGSKGKILFFLNVVLLHIMLKGKKYRPTYKKKNFDLTHTSDSWSG